MKKLRLVFQLVLVPLIFSNAQEGIQNPSGQKKLSKSTVVTVRLYGNELKATAIFIKSPDYALRKDVEAGLVDIYAILTSKALREKIIAIHPALTGVLVVTPSESATTDIWAELSKCERVWV